MGDLALLRCSIGASAFSGERVYRFGLHCGSDYSGVAPVGYFRGHGHERMLRMLLRGEPEPGATMMGYVEVYRMACDGDGVTIRLPDDSIVDVPAAAIEFVEAGRVTKWRRER